MSRREMASSGRGYFAIGIHGAKTESNIGSLFRTASLYGAALVFTVGARYYRQASDTPNTPAHTPLIHFADIEDLVEHLPYSCPLIGVEMDEQAKPLAGFGHPLRAAYLLGAEDNGIPPAVLKRCHQIVQIETPAPWSMNVACAGSVLLWDRHRKARRP